jgi:hypothetical protein
VKKPRKRRSQKRASLPRREAQRKTLLIANPMGKARVAVRRQRMGSILLFNSIIKEMILRSRGGLSLILGRLANPKKTSLTLFSQRRTLNTMTPLKIARIMQKSCKEIMEICLTKLNFSTSSLQEYRRKLENLFLLNLI